MSATHINLIAGNLSDPNCWQVSDCGSFLSKAWWNVTGITGINAVYLSQERFGGGYSVRLVTLDEAGEIVDMVSHDRWSSYPSEREHVRLVLEGRYGSR